MHDLFEPGSEAGKIVVLAGLLPDILGPRGDAGQFLDQAGRHLHGPVARPADLTQVDGLVAGRILDEIRPGQAADQIAETRRGDFLMGELGNQGHLIGPMRRALGRHVGALVPAEQAADRVEQAIFLEVGEQFIVGLHRDGPFTTGLPFVACRLALNASRIVSEMSVRFISRFISFSEGKPVSGDG